MPEGRRASDKFKTVLRFHSYFQPRKDGFLKRTVSEGDARSKHLELTEKGSYICIKEKLFMDSCDSAIQNALSPQEQEELEKLLQKIIDSISN